MNFHFLDYSQIYFQELLKAPIPSKRSGKFVQITNSDTDDEFLVLSPKEFSKYHATIVERFCLLHGKVPGSYSSSKKDHFVISDSGWQILGGGMWAIDEEKRTLTLGGRSTAYGTFDSLDLKNKIRSQKELASYLIVIDGK